MKYNCGIYKILNTKNGNYYVGSSTNIKKRWKQHKYKLRHNKHSNDHLQKAWNKYGEDSFNFELVEKTNTNNILDREQHYLDNCECHYNLCPNAHSVLGLTHTEETKQKMSEAHMGVSKSEEHRKNIAKAKMGEKNPQYGKTRSKKWRERMSKLLSGENNPQFGISRSEEILKRMSEAQKGKTLSEETKSKISKAMSGREISKETREKLSKAHKGKTISRKQRKDISKTLGKFNEKEIREIINRYKNEKISYNELGKEYDVNSATIGKIVRRETYKWVDLLSNELNQKAKGE